MLVTSAEISAARLSSSSGTSPPLPRAPPLDAPSMIDPPPARAACATADGPAVRPAAYGRVDMAPRTGERHLGGGVVLWRRTTAPGTATRVLPDGCLDLIWTGGSLVVAGPDPVARVVEHAGQSVMTGVRLPFGLGPALLGLPASELLGRAVDLADLWSDRDVEPMIEAAGEDSAAALRFWVTAGVRRRPPDPLGRRVHALAESGVPVAAMAERLGLGVRRLHRRSTDLFGYGPERLIRILRLRRALADARSGTALADVAHRSGYADQAHLARDVRALSGLAPSRLLQTERAQRSAAKRSTVPPSGSRTTA